MKKVLGRILDWIVFIFTGGGEIAREAEAAGICDYSYGRGRRGVEAPPPTKERGDEHGT